MFVNSKALYVCASPIGNLQDCSFRLIQTLQQVGLIACEDTRKTQILLRHFQIHKPCISLEKYNEKERIQKIIDSLEQGLDVALISEAGTPNIADPGAYVIEHIAAKGYKIIPIPGPAAVTTLLSVSGILANRFIFGGFLPKKPAQITQLLDQIAVLDMPIVFYESGLRLKKALQAIQAFDSTAYIVLGKELTKLHENIFKGPVNKFCEEFEQINLKGEWCFIVKFITKPKVKQDLAQTIEFLQKQKLSNRQILAIATKVLNLPKNQVYKLLINHD